MHYFLIAGEASGDLHASRLITALRRRDSKAKCTFLGGNLMEDAAHTPPVIHYRDMAFMGFSEVLRHLPQIRRNMAHTRALIKRLRPDALILIDYPGFNLNMAAYAHGLGIPVYYYIPPKVWAWKEYRVKSLRRYCRRILSILPFEVPFYRSHRMAVDYVGNPSVEEVNAQLAKAPTPQEWRRLHGLSDKPILALVPGSRMGEIRCNLPLMVAVARRHPDMLPVIARAPGIDAEVYASFSDFKVVEGSTLELMANAQVALVTSGTATLECALAGTPQVVCYRSNGSALAYHLMKRLLHVKYVALPNLIADGPIVPEMLLHHCTPDLVDAQLQQLLPSQPGRQRQLEGYSLMRQALGTSIAPDKAADIICADLRK